MFGCSLHLFFHSKTFPIFISHLLRFVSRTPSIHSTTTATITTRKHQKMPIFNKRFLRCWCVQKKEKLWKQNENYSFFSLFLYFESIPLIGNHQFRYNLCTNELYHHTSLASKKGILFNYRIINYIQPRK